MNIYVGNLPYKVKDEDLKEIFEEYGPIKSARVMTDKFSGRSKGFGFVELVDEDRAKKALAELDGGELDGKRIVVNEARPKTETRKSRY